MRFFNCAAVVLLALTWSMAGDEDDDVVFSQEPDQLGAFLADEGTVEFFGIGIEIGDDFSFAKKTKIRSVVWYGFYPSFFGSPPEDDDFSISFYEDDGGVPAATPFAQYSVGDGDRKDAELPIDGTFVYQANIPKTEFKADKIYYISIKNDTTGEDALWAWESANTGEGGPIFFREDFGGGWEDWAEDFGHPGDPTASDYDTTFSLSTKKIDGDDEDCDDDD